MVVRYQPINHSLTLTLPRYVSIKQGLTFIEEKRRWIEQQLAQKPAQICFHDGMRMEILGRRVTLKHVGGRGVVRLQADDETSEAHLLVSGDAEFFARRVRDFLLRSARDEMTRLANHYAARLGVSIRKISLRDTHSLWGSCNHAGHLSFSWRLVLAPYEVLDYVVCHEVAHLVHLNHSKAYWQVVAMICPDFERHRDWLRQHGSTLYRYRT